MTFRGLEFRRPREDDKTGLLELFRVLGDDPQARGFHPHPFDATNARRVCRYQGPDLYYIAATGRKVIAYGMLRGWDEGYERPSLGLAVHPSERDRGLGRAMMLFLHAAARARGCEEILLKVYESNAAALELYRSLGYELGPSDRPGELVGVLRLVR